MNAIRDELDQYDRAELETSQPGAPEPGPIRHVDEPAMLYGGRLLAYVIRTQSTAVLSDDDLELADHAACYAVARPDLADDPIRLTPLLACVSDARHRIARSLKARRQPVVDVVPVSTPAGRPNIGPMAPLELVPIGRPPAGVAVDVGF